MTTGPKWYLGVIKVLRFSALVQNYTRTTKWTMAGSNLQMYKERSILALRCKREFLTESMFVSYSRDHKENIYA